MRSLDYHPFGPSSGAGRARSRSGSRLPQLGAIAFAIASSLGCAKESVNPLDCEFPDYVYDTSAEASPAVDVEFSDTWGEAPAQMDARVVHAEPSTLAIQACGRDQNEREWELRAVWSRVPTPPEYPLEIAFFDRARIEAGERLEDGMPSFDAALVQCSKYGCIA